VNGEEKVGINSYFYSGIWYQGSGI